MMERNTNERIREIIEMKHSIIDNVGTKQLNWFGHVQRMDIKQIGKQSQIWREEKRKGGRPRISWMQRVNKNNERWGCRRYFLER